MVKKSIGVGIMIALLLLILGIIYIMNTPDNNSLAIQKATEVFAEKNLDLSKYDVSVINNGDTLVVVFLDKNRTVNTIGNPGILPGFEVELDAKDLHVLKSHFIR